MIQIKISLNKGFTLVELLISMVALGIFIMLKTGIYFNIMRSAIRQNIQTEVKQNGDLAINMIVSDIRSAHVIDTEGVSFNQYCLSSHNTLSIYSGNKRIEYSVGNHDIDPGVQSIKKIVTDVNSGTLTTQDLTSPDVAIEIPASGMFTCSYSPNSGLKLKVEFIGGNPSALTPVPGRFEEFNRQTFRGYAVSRNLQ